MTKKATSTSNALTVLPSEEKALAAVSREFENARRMVRALKASAGMMAVNMIFTGLEIARLKKKFGVTRGGDRRSNTRTLGLKWEDILQQELGVSDEWARQLMMMAEGAKKRVASVNLQKLMETPMEHLTEEQFKLLEKAFVNLVDGRTGSEMLLNLGIVKAPKAIGGGAGRPKGSTTEQEDITELAKHEVWAVMSAAGRVAIEDEFEVHLKAVPMRAKGGVEHENASLHELSETLKAALRRVTNIKLQREKKGGKSS